MDGVYSSGVEEKVLQEEEEDERLSRILEKQSFECHSQRVNPAQTILRTQDSTITYYK